MTDTTIGLYDSDGASIIEYNQFDSFGIEFMYISTGYGSSGRWALSTAGNFFNILSVVTKSHEYRCQL